MTPAEIHALETELLAVASWSLGLGPSVAASAEQTAHVAIALAGASARLLSTLPPAVASEIRAHLVVTEASLRELDDDVLELLTEYTEDAKVGCDPAAESSPSPTVRTENGDSGPAIAGHGSARGNHRVRVWGERCAEGVDGHGPSTPLDVVVRELIRQPRPGASEGGAS